MAVGPAMICVVGEVGGVVGGVVGEVGGVVRGVVGGVVEGVVGGMVEGVVGGAVGGGALHDRSTSELLTPVTVSVGGLAWAAKAAVPCPPPATGLAKAGAAPRATARRTPARLAIAAPLRLKKTACHHIKHSPVRPQTAPFSYPALCPRSPVSETR